MNILSFSSPLTYIFLRLLTGQDALLKRTYLWAVRKLGDSQTDFGFIRQVSLEEMMESSI